jgi:uncharacterized coiled-coil protein SlyX
MNPTELKQTIEDLQRGLNNMFEELEKLKKAFLAHKHETKEPKF